jgi:hypothetical protein
MNPMRPILAAALACLVSGPRASAASSRDCLTNAESRDVVRHNNLARPAAALKEAAGRARAEPLRSRLCRWNSEFIYEITLLRPDGKMTRVSVRAKDGLIVNTASE